MHIKEKFYKIKSIYIYIVSITFTLGITFFIANSKYNYSEIKTIIISGDISGNNILPQQAISLAFSNPRYLNQINSNLCHINLAINENQNIKFSYEIVSDTVGFIKIRSHDINWLKENGNECIKKIINAINQYEIEFINYKRYKLNLNSFEITKNNFVSFNLTKEFGNSAILQKPEIDNMYKIITLGLLLGLLFAYGISHWLKNK